MISPPTTHTQLLERAQALAGFTLHEVAQRVGLTVPNNLLVNKGWIGQLLEVLLGATAQSKAEPDFQNLAVELKTIPITEGGKPLETTFVCTARLHDLHGISWRECVVYKKLAHVLWIPILSPTSANVSQRIICAPLLWRMNSQIENVLRSDWEELMELISLGNIDKITGKNGRFLHVRPKAANAGVVTTIFDSEGDQQLTLPRGFYLRTQFTAQLLSEHFHF